MADIDTKSEARSTPKKSVDQKVILVTGCSSGIGLESAILCAKNGHTVYATVRNASRASQLQTRIKDENLDNIKVLEMDVSSTLSMDNALSETIAKSGKIDVLFNNAGFMIMGSLEDLTMSEIQSQIDTDLMGPIYLTKNVIPHMHGTKNGLIINMSSVAGKIGFQLSSAYCVSKFGIEGFTESLRRELKPRNIDVCLIEAGIVNTKFFQNMRRSRLSYSSRYARETSEMKSVIDKINKKNWSSPEEVANLVLSIIKGDNVECRYVLGSDATYLIDSLYHNRDNCEKMDNTIIEIMSQYTHE